MMSNKLFMTNTFLKKVKLLKNQSPVFERHMKLNKKYKEDASSAMITDRAEVVGTDFHDPFAPPLS